MPEFPDVTRASGRVGARVRAGLTVLLFVAVVVCGLWLAMAGRVAGVSAPPWWTPSASAFPATGAPISSAPAPSAPESGVPAPTTPRPSPRVSAPSSSLDGDPATVLKVVDGDTIDVQRAGERVRVRLLNIDTPETKAPGQAVECLGPQASAFTARLLPPGTRVTLRYDRVRYDQYGRTLAGVFVGERLINREIAAAGLATPVTFGANRRFRAEVDAAYAQARQARRGFFDPAAHCPAPTPR